MATSASKKLVGVSVPSIRSMALLASDGPLTVAFLLNRVGNADSLFETPPISANIDELTSHSSPRNVRMDADYNADAPQDGFLQSSLQTFPDRRHRADRSPVDLALSVSCPSSQDDQVTVVTLRNVWRLSPVNAYDGNTNDDFLSVPFFTIPVQEFNPNCSCELVVN